MAVFVKNESGSDYRFSGHSNQKLFPAGTTMMLSDEEWDSVITGKRGPGQLNPILFPVDTTTSVYGVRLDDVGGGVSYVGEALPGTSTNVAQWRIKRIVEVGADISVTWADGVSAFTKKWDDRLTYTYS